MPSIEQLERLLDPDHPDPFILYGLAQEHAKRREFVRAIEYFDRCLATDPTYCYAYFHKARAQEELNDPATARATLEAGIAVARKAGDGHAESEMRAALEML